MGRTLKDRKQTYDGITAFPDRWYVPVAKLGVTFNRDMPIARKRATSGQRSERDRGARGTRSDRDI